MRPVFFGGVGRRPRPTPRLPRLDYPCDWTYACVMVEDSGRKTKMPKLRDAVGPHLPFKLGKLPARPGAVTFKFAASWRPPWTVANRSCPFDENVAMARLPSLSCRTISVFFAVKNHIGPRSPSTCAVMG